VKEYVAFKVEDGNPAFSAWMASCLTRKGLSLCVTLPDGTKGLRGANRTKKYSDRRLLCEIQCEQGDDSRSVEKIDMTFYECKN